MKTFAFTLAAALFLATSAHAKTVHVRPHITKRGTYVSPSYRTAPDKSKFNNYSTKGNVNPYTGKSGTIDPYKLPAIK